jgi:hypothetical protein
LQQHQRERVEDREPMAGPGYLGPINKLKKQKRNTVKDESYYFARSLDVLMG